MTSGPCLRGCRVVRRYMPTNIGNHSSVVKDECNNYVSMYFEPLQPLGPVNTGVPPSGGTYVPQTQAGRYHEIRGNRQFFGQVGGEHFVSRCDETKWCAFRVFF